MAIVCRDPKATPLREPVISMASSSSSRLSSIPVTVALTMDALVPTPAGSVSVVP